MKRFYTLLVIFITISSWLNIASAQNESTWMPDANLRASVRPELGLADGTALTQAGMLNLTALIARNESIANLTGLEHATNLTKLDLSPCSPPYLDGSLDLEHGELWGGVCLFLISPM